MTSTAWSSTLPFDVEAGVADVVVVVGFDPAAADFAGTVGRAAPPFVPGNASTLVTSGMVLPSVWSLSPGRFGCATLPTVTRHPLNTVTSSSTLSLGNPLPSMEPIHAQALLFLPMISKRFPSGGDARLDPFPAL